MLISGLLVSVLWSTKSACGSKGERGISEVQHPMQVINVLRHETLLQVNHACLKTECVPPCPCLLLAAMMIAGDGRMTGREEERKRERESRVITTPLL